MKIALAVDGGPRAAALFQAFATAAAVLCFAIGNDINMPESIELVAIACYGHLIAFTAGSRA